MKFPFHSPTLPLSKSQMIRSAVAVRANKGVTGTFAANAGDLRIHAVLDKSIVTSNDPYFDITTLSVSVEKPASFILDYNVPNQEVRFQFMNTVRVMDKQLNWTYTHCRNDNRTVLDGTLLVDTCNKVSGSCELGTNNRKLKYSYVHRGVTTLEPCFDFGRKEWEFALSRSFDEDVIRAKYNTGSKDLGVEFSWKDLMTKEGRIKLLASFNLAEGIGRPKLSVESSWNFGL